MWQRQQPSESSFPLGLASARWFVICSYSETAADLWSCADKYGQAPALLMPSKGGFKKPEVCDFYFVILVVEEGMSTAYQGFALLLAFTY